MADKTKNQNQLLTRKEAAEFLRTSPVSVYRWERQGLLKGLRAGGLVRYRVSDIEDFLGVDTSTRGS